MAKTVEKLTKIWESFIDEMEKKVDPHIFENWIGPLELYRFEEGKLEINVPNHFYKSWIEANFMDQITDVLTRLIPLDFTIVFRVIEKPVKPKTDTQVKNEIISIKKEGIKKKKTSSTFIPKSTLDNDYTFENFVVGPSNEFAKGMALYVTKNPGKSYNPLFIYGGVGLGKTHLMQGIGHEILKKQPDCKVLYLSAERFMNELIYSYGTDSIIKFRKKFRNIDLLLMDDIQFVTGKKGTQEEFFHTFNTLYERGQQIVLTSDRPPKKIPDLQERLVSRFASGIVVDIQAPNLETRIAILKKKAMHESISIPNDILNFIAKGFKSNVRELEGALTKVIAYTVINNKDLTLDNAKIILKDIIHQKDSSEITADLIQRTVATFFDIRVADFKAKKRTKSIALPRQIAMYLTRELTDASLPEIGELFGGRDHTTVIHAYKKIQGLIESNDPVRYQIQNILNELKGNE